MSSPSSPKEMEDRETGSDLRNLTVRLLWGQAGEYGGRRHLEGAGESLGTVLALEGCGEGRLLPAGALPRTKAWLEERVA